MEFRVDDHQYWPEDPKQDLHQEVENKWKNISEKTETDMETFSSEESQQAGNLIGQVQVENRDRYDYREFLRKIFGFKRRSQCGTQIRLTIYFTVMGFLCMGICR